MTDTIKIVGDIPKRYFGGTKGAEVDRERFPLAFLTPLGTTKADLKRQQTVRDWASNWVHTPDGTQTTPDGKEVPKFRQEKKDGNTFEVENEWLTGFVFDRVVSRYRTDNKVFRVQDPRGFSLEIYSDCMIRVLQSAHIVKGEIQDRCCWARRDGKMYLLVENSEEHLEYVKLQEDRATTTIQPGDIVDQLGHKEVYVGPFYALKFEFDPDRKHPDGQGYVLDSANGWSWGDRPRTWTYRYVMKVSTTPKPWKVTVPWSDAYTKDFSIRREWAKNQRSAGKAPPEKIVLPEFGKKLGRWETVIFYENKAAFDEAVRKGNETGWKDILDGWVMNHERESRGNSTTVYEVRWENPNAA